MADIIDSPLPYIIGTSAKLWATIKRKTPLNECNVYDVSTKQFISKESLCHLPLLISRDAIALIDKVDFRSKYGIFVVRQKLFNCFLLLLKNLPSYFKKGLSNILKKPAYQIFEFEKFLGSFEGKNDLYGFLKEFTGTQCFCSVVEACSSRMDYLYSALLKSEQDVIKEQESLFRDEMIHKKKVYYIADLFIEYKKAISTHHNKHGEYCNHRNIFTIPRYKRAGRNCSGVLDRSMQFTLKISDKQLFKPSRNRFITRGEHKIAYTSIVSKSSLRSEDDIASEFKEEDTPIMKEMTYKSLSKMPPMSNYCGAFRDCATKMSTPIVSQNEGELCDFLLDEIL